MSAQTNCTYVEALGMALGRYPAFHPNIDSPHGRKCMVGIALLHWLLYKKASLVASRHNWYIYSIRVDDAP